jgi:hypothetical protein
MIPLQRLKETLALSAQGVSDRAGKRPLDALIEEVNESLASARTQLAREIAMWLGSELSPEDLELLREFVRRTQIDPEILAPAFERFLHSACVSNDVSRRLWVSLILMDLGFNRSVASLRNDIHLFEKHPGEWLTLMVATKSFPDVVEAFQRAIGRVSTKLLKIKSELVRQQFGSRLADFLPAIISVYPTGDEKQDMVAWAKDIYGYDLSHLLRGRAFDDLKVMEPSADMRPSVSAEEWCDQKTIGIVTKALAA